MNDLFFVGRHLTTYAVQTHKHDEWELIYCTSGKGEVFFENGSTMQYKTGEIVAIPPHMLHSNRSVQGFTNIHVRIADATFPYKFAVKITDDHDAHIKTCFSEALFYYNSDINRKELVLSALGELIVSYIITFQSQNSFSEMVELIRNDILKNFSDTGYCLEDYIRTIPFNYDYLRKLFKKEMGVTPHEYMTTMRMKKAEKLLLAMRVNEYTIGEIAEMCGFDEPLYFSRVFKKTFGKSPSAFVSDNCASDQKA